jgi:hypothetical protein
LKRAAESIPAANIESMSLSQPPKEINMITNAFRHVLPMIVGVALSFSLVAAQAARGGHGTTPAPTPTTNTKVKPALETCGAGQHCTGMPHKKCTTEYVAVCHRHHAACQTVQKTVCS